MATHAVRFDVACDQAAENLGGYEMIDDSLAPFLNGLHHNPQGFRIVDAFWGRVRCIPTIAIGDLPALIWYFVIEAKGDVLITQVERYDDAVDY